MVICPVSEPQVSEAPHVAQLPLHTRRQSRYNTSEPSKSEKQTLVAKSTAFARRLARLGDTRSECTEGAWTDTRLARTLRRV